MRLAELELPTRRTTIRLAQQLAPWLRVGDLVLLTGELGTGKTFLARALCRALGVPTHERVTSPSFALVHEHEGRIPIVHADLYRVAAGEEVEHLGLRAERANALVIVEWGKAHAERLGPEHVEIALTLDGGHRRALVEADLAAGDDRSACMAHAIGLADPALGP